jgi:hypothetical protein
MTKFNTNSVKKGQHAIVLFQTTQFFYSAGDNFSKTTIHSLNFIASIIFETKINLKY